MYGKKTIKLIVAMSEKNVIGQSDGTIPWKGLLPSDMKRFKSLTSAKGANSVIMGRKTWDSLPEKFRPLTDRQNIIVTRDLDLTIKHPLVSVANYIEEALEKARPKTVWIIGGEQIYRQVFDFVDEIHLTKVCGEFIGDIVFPDLSSEFNNWALTQDTAFNALPDKICSFYKIYCRKKK